MRNLVTNVPGVKIGNAHDARAATGVTVAVFDKGRVVSAATPAGTRVDRAVTLLEPEMTCSVIDAVLSGGPLYGLDAAGGASAVLCAQGKGDDGDPILAASPADAGPDQPPALTEPGDAAADFLARAVVRGLVEATALPYGTSLPDYRQRFGG